MLAPGRQLCFALQLENSSKWKKMEDLHPASAYLATHVILVNPVRKIAYESENKD